jgi:hypothetical protein
MNESQKRGARLFTIGMALFAIGLAIKGEAFRIIGLALVALALLSARKYKIQ